MGYRHRRFKLFALAIVAGAFLACLAAPAAAQAATVKAYRLFNQFTGAHLITVDTNEYRQLQRMGWQGEGNAFNVQNSGSTPVYRLYNPNNGDHFYTASYNEYRDLQRSGWRGENVKFYGVSASQGNPVYRLYNWRQKDAGGLGSHLWTDDANEYNSLPRMTGGAWSKENVAWYAYRGTKPSNPSYIDASGGKMATFQGVLVREEWPTWKTGMGWSAVYYFLKLDKPVNVCFTGPEGRTTYRLSYIQVSNIEQYLEKANIGLNRIFSDRLQPYVGFPVSIRGTVLHAGTAHYAYPAFKYDSWTISYLN